MAEAAPADSTLAVHRGTSAVNGACRHDRYFAVAAGEQLVQFALSGSVHSEPRRKPRHPKRFRARTRNRPPRTSSRAPMATISPTPGLAPVLARSESCFPDVWSE